MDNIVNYLKTPRDLTDLDPRLERDSFALMTYHSQTVGSFDIPAAMELSIRTIIEKDKRILITYPNNDDGSEVILDVINRWSSNENVIVIPNLGVKNYHAAIDNCLFVIGNSSSGVIEVPYFDKFTVNVASARVDAMLPSRLSIQNPTSNFCNLLSVILLMASYRFPSKNTSMGEAKALPRLFASSNPSNSKLFRSIGVWKSI